MTKSGVQQNLEVITQNDIASAASKSQQQRKQRPSPTKQQCELYIQNSSVAYQAPVKVVSREWEPADQRWASWTPIRLFMLLFQPTLQLLFEHTNNTYFRDPKRPQGYKPFTLLEMRRWLACRLEMMNTAITVREIAAFWSTKAVSIRYIGYQRKALIERYLSVCSGSPPPQHQYTWYWRVEPAISALRERLKIATIPGSHLCVDESAIKFHGRKIDTYRIPHKPAKQGFVIYSLASYGGVIHDFAVASSQNGIEGVQGGITLDIATRTTRRRRNGMTGHTGREIHLPQTKAVVYHLLAKIRAQYQCQDFVCYTDNLFTDAHLAQALLALNIAIVGTVRKSAVGFPAIHREINHQYPQILPDDAVIHEVVDTYIDVVTWKDQLRGNVVSFMTTLRYDSDRILAKRNFKHTTATRANLAGCEDSEYLQPTVAVDYNSYMGAVDEYNQLRATRGVGRPRQRKWTKKMLDWNIDTCHTVAFAISERYDTHQSPGHRQRAQFLQQLIGELVDIKECKHKASRGSKWRECAYSACRPRRQSNTIPLGESNGNRPRTRHAQTQWRCDECTVALCKKRGCFTAYHEARRLEYHSE